MVKRYSKHAVLGSGSILEVWSCCSSRNLCLSLLIMIQVHRNRSIHEYSRGLDSKVFGVSSLSFLMVEGLVVILSYTYTTSRHCNVSLLTW